MSNELRAIVRFGTNGGTVIELPPGEAARLRNDLQQAIMWAETATSSAEADEPLSRLQTLASMLVLP